MVKINIAVFISGRGTNLQSIIDSAQAGEIPVDIKIVISDNKDAYGLTRARNAGIEARWVDPGKYENDREFEDELLEILKTKKIELVALAGFMRLLSPYFLNNFSGEAMNIHPSLLPSFRGLHPQKQALDYGVKVSGCTVHFVDEGMDTGPIILQKAVPVGDSDDEESLANRILEKEHEIYPEAIRLYAEGNLELKGRKVIRKEKKYEI
ncbi:MAG: phosphoribosylglycinamide formyltransferase [Halanaerobiales bacterium]